MLKQDKGAGVSQIWAKIPGFPNYEVSTLGEVKNVKTDKMLKADKTWNGYLRFTLYEKNVSKRYSAHRLVALIFIPNPQNKPQVNHIDTNKLNNTVINLEWHTCRENMHHAVDMGLYHKPDIKHNFPDDQTIYLLKNSYRRKIKINIKPSSRETLAHQIFERRRSRDRAKRKRKEYEQQI